MRKHTRLATAAVLAASLLSAEAMALCAERDDQAALDVRMLQTELMVAALTCNSQDRYNDFVRKFRTELISHGKHLRRFFGNAYGSQSRQKLDGFITRLANKASQRSLVGREDYCPAAEALFDRVTVTARDFLWRTAIEQPFSGAHGIAACGDTGTRVADKTPQKQ